MAVNIYTSRSRAPLATCPRCKTEPVNRPGAKYCVDCRDETIDANSRSTTARKRVARASGPRDIAASIARAIDRDRELDRLHNLTIRGK